MAVQYLCRLITSAVIGVSVRLSSPSKRARCYTVTLRRLEGRILGCAYVGSLLSGLNEYYGALLESGPQLEESG